MAGLRWPSRRSAVGRWVLQDARRLSHTFAHLPKPEMDLHAVSQVAAVSPGLECPRLLLWHPERVAAHHLPKGKSCAFLAPSPPHVSGTWRLRSMMCSLHAPGGGLALGGESHCLGLRRGAACVSTWHPGRRTWELAVGQRRQ